MVITKHMNIVAIVFIFFFSSWEILILGMSQADRSASAVKKVTNPMRDFVIANTKGIGSKINI